jgi:hypothetical protein
MRANDGNFTKLIKASDRSRWRVDIKTFIDARFFSLNSFVLSLLSETSTNEPKFLHRCYL